MLIGSRPVTAQQCPPPLAAGNIASLGALRGCWRGTGVGRLGLLSRSVLKVALLHDASVYCISGTGYSASALNPETAPDGVNGRHGSGPSRYR